jgi:hypothetical protein
MIRVTLLSLLFAATASADSKSPAELEPISVTNIVPHAKSATLSIRAMSGGCTRAADFRVDLDKQSKRTVLTIVRTKVDACELYAPNGTTLDLDVTGLATDQPIALANPLFVSARR